MTPPPGISIVQAVQLIMAAPAPVLLPDTCALLDVVRAPARNMNYLIDLAEQMTALATAAPKGLHLVISETVTHEWNEHLPSTEAEVERYLQTGRETVQSLREACQALGCPPPHPLPAELTDVPALLAAAATRLYDSALVLALDSDCLSRAYTRQAQHQRPGRRGKSINDCVIVEHALCLCAALQATGFAPARVFASSNTADYCEGRSLHPQLAPAFRATGLQFVTDLRGARYRLNL